MTGQNFNIFLSFKKWTVCNTGQKRFLIFRSACALYIFSLLFQDLLPGAVQLPEIIFCCILILAVLFRYHFVPKKVTVVDVALSVYVLSLFVSAVLCHK